ncbi:MAG: AzlC family ABC transporter permease [Helicobacter sp.]|nr:AzlC family ABC transporter permease [Helicobacter sp.]
MIYKTFFQTLPVCMGYIPLGIAFGILFSQLNIAWYYGFLTATFIFTGAGQFLLISLLSSHSGYFEIALASFVLNTRHLFYSLSITEEIKSFGLGKYYILLGLTDETFALLKTLKYTNSLPQEQLEKSYLCITLWNHLYWIVGCMTGIFIGENLGFTPEGIKFTLTALFSVLTLALLKNSPNKKPFYLGLGLGILGLAIFPQKYFLFLSILCGIFILLIGKKWIEYGK